MTDWPHAPKHQISEKGTYMVTSATYQKVHYFNSNEHLQFLQNTLFKLASDYNWQLQAWAIFSNHYHFIAESPNKAENLRAFISQLHVTTAKYINQCDNTPCRRVWWQYWDSRITFQHSYLARLNYVNQNPVKHGHVAEAMHYPWCSANWFEEKHPRSFCKTVAGFKTDKISIIDDF